MRDVLELRRSETGQPIWRLEVASSFVGRLRGLIGRSTLAERAGLFLPHTNSVHMLFMRFPIDCLFLGPERRDGRRTVLATRSGLAPWTGIVWWVRGAHGAVEVPAGSIAASGLGVGDEVVLSQHVSITRRGSSASPASRAALTVRSGITPARFAARATR